MKIIHVISSMGIGGAQRLLVDLLPIQKKQGIDVSLLVLRSVDNDFSRIIYEAGIPICTIGMKSYYNPLAVSKIRAIIKEYDIVHVHLFHSLYYCSLAARGVNVHMVYTEHSTSNGRRKLPFLRPLESFIYGRYKRIVSISEQTQTALQKWIKGSGNRYSVINNGVDTSRFSCIKKTILPNSLIMVSRFAPAKDQETVIRALQYINKDASIRFVGIGANIEHCKQITKELGLSDRVEFLGARSDVADLIAESYIGIQSSNWEGFGLTAVEIMAAGKPIVASNVDGLKQVVEGAGELFSKGDYKELSEKINHLLENKDYYNMLSQRSIERASLYDIHSMADKYHSIYSELLNKE